MTSDYQDKYIKLLEKHIKMLEAHLEVKPPENQPEALVLPQKSNNKNSNTAVVVSKTESKAVSNSNDDEVEKFADKLFSWLQKRKKVLVSSTEISNHGYRRDKWLPAIQLLENQKRVTFIGKSVVDGKNYRQVWRVNA